jgi:LAO/AO transport system kinase
MNFQNKDYNGDALRLIIYRGRMNTISDLLNQLSIGSVTALARLITMVENEQPGALEALQRLYPKTGNAYIIGITGPPGSGKSTLTDKITLELRHRGCTVGIIAADPSSPFTGGALLGDRVRMQESLNDEGVFFRSMATRGTMGGLCKTTLGVIELLDAFGKDYILLETVGVGQDELDIIKIADTTLLISVPGLGDDIQSLKAGIMEIGDIHVVNKADRDGADQLISDLNLMYDLSTITSSWMPPVVRTIAVENEGIGELIEKMLAHRKFLETGKGLQQKRSERIRKEIAYLIKEEISRSIYKMFEDNMFFDDAVERIARREKDPYSFVREVAENLTQYSTIHGKMRLDV